MVKLVYGVGINDANYVTQLSEELGYVDGVRKRKLVWICPFYQAWRDMLGRGYSERCKLKRPTYRGVTVCEDWWLFSTFRLWMEQQDYKGNHLDKDLLIRGNKVYCPEACVFISAQVNTFMAERCGDRGEYKIGVYWVKKDCKFTAQCSNPFTNKQENLGRFLTEEAAHRAWLSKKLEHAKALSALQTNEMVAKALVDRYENYS